MDKTTAVLLTFSLTSLLGCTPAVTFTQYSPPSGAEIIDVELIALDKYRNSDTVRLSVVSRASCTEKPIIAQVATVGSNGLFAKDSTYQVGAKLPVAQLLNLSISNISSSGYVTTHCVETAAVVFEKSRQYKIKVHNWSSPNSSHSGFGCKFDVVDVGNVGSENFAIKLDPPQLPVCDEK